jgi:hypothetical protein
MAGKGAGILTGGANDDMFVFSVAGAMNTITNFHDGEDLIDLRPLLSGYHGSDPVADGVIATSVMPDGSVVISVDPSMSGTLTPLVELMPSPLLGNLGIGTDILWH